MHKVKIFDSTLRDGLHALNQSITLKNISSYCNAINKSGVYTTIVGHGNGIGASSIHMGLCSEDELKMLEYARKNINSSVKLGTFVTVGMGTVNKHIIPAIERGVELFCIACNCTEANITRKHIEFLKENNIEVYCVFMNIHLSDTVHILEQAKLVETYGADGLILMDSAGSSVPEYIEELIGTLKNNLEFDIGYHAHNNLGLAVSNSYTAIKNGVSIIDGTIGGIGAGAGNCPIDVLQALLQKEAIDTGVNFFEVLDISRDIVRGIFNYDKSVDDISIISGYAGVVSTLKTQVIAISEKYNVDPRKVFMKLGNIKIVTGQDDMILEIAQKLSNNN